MARPTQSSQSAAQTTAAAASKHTAPRVVAVALDAKGRPTKAFGPFANTNQLKKYLPGLQLAGVLTPGAYALVPLVSLAPGASTGDDSADEAEGGDGATGQRGAALGEKGAD